MIVKKFEADSLESALKLIKSEMGPEALILSTENRKGSLFRKSSVEVTAAAAAAAVATKTPPKSQKEFDEEQLARVFPHRRLEKVIAPDTALHDEMAARAVRPRTTSRAGAPAYGRASAPPAPPEVPPQVRRLEKEFLDLGINSDTAAEFAGRVILNFNRSDREDPEFLEKVKSKLLAAGMRTLGPEVFESRRCWAAVGTPGCGKTTVLVKLGLWLKQHKQSVALVSCDRRKIIGRQELAAYAKLIRTPFSAQVKGDRPGAKVQLIDTPSLNWESKEVTGDIEKICRDTNTLLVLDASQRLDELIRTVDKAASLAPVAIAFTRLDTIARAGVIYELLKAVKLPLLGASISYAFSTPFQFFEPVDLGRWIVTKVRASNKQEGSHG